MTKPIENEEDMTVDIELEEGTVTCDVASIFEINGQDYIVLVPKTHLDGIEEGDYWYYRYYENPDDPNEEPVLEYIESDEEYEMVDEAFDAYLDQIAFDETEE